MSKNVYFNDKLIPTTSFRSLRIGSSHSKSKEEAIAKFLENIDLVKSLTPEERLRIRSDPSLLEVVVVPHFSTYHIRLKEPEAVKQEVTLQGVDDIKVKSVEEIDDTPAKEEATIPMYDTPLKSLEKADDTPAEPVKKVDLGLLVESTIGNARRDAQAKSFVHPPGEEDTFEEDAESDDEPYNVLGDSVAEKDAEDAIAELQKDYDDLEIKDGGTRRNKKNKKRMTKKRKTRRSTQKKRKTRRSKSKRKR
jgi:hypothetical protein